MEKSISSSILFDFNIIKRNCVNKLLEIHMKRVDNLIVLTKIKMWDKGFFLFYFSFGFDCVQEL